MRRSLVVRHSKSPGLLSLVQLGGLEPPTSCSTDRRSNQLSYNCIRRGAEKRLPNGAETRCNAALWQGREVSSRRTPGPITTDVRNVNAAVATSRVRLTPEAMDPGVRRDDIGQTK